MTVIVNTPQYKNMVYGASGISTIAAKSVAEPSNWIMDITPANL